MSQCPACNGLITVSEPCPNCGHTLCDFGSRDDYYGAYRPYMSEEFPNSICTHLLHCTDCGNSISWPVPVMR